MLDDMLGMLIPISIFVCITLIVFLVMLFNHKNRRLVLEVVQASLDKGHDLDPALVESLSKPNPDSDFRKGVINLSIAFSLVSFALLLGEPDAVRPISGVACFPGIVGLAYLAFHYNALRKAKQQA